MKRTTTKEVYDYYFRKTHDPIKSMALCYFADFWMRSCARKHIAPFKFTQGKIGPTDTSVFSESDKKGLDPKLVDYLYFTWTVYKMFEARELMAKANTYFTYCRNKPQKINRLLKRQKRNRYRAKM